MLSTSTEPRSFTRSEWEEIIEPSHQSSRPLDLDGRVVLLATDGSPGAVAAAHVAYELAEKHQAVVHVVFVVDTRSTPIPPPLYVALEIGDALAASAANREHERAVRAELAAAIGAKVDWPVRVMLGTPAVSIVKEADRLDAALVLVGLRRHSRLDRAVHDETALNVMRSASCPVLGVVPELRDLPARILAAIDFGDGSLHATRAARAMSGDDATLVLAYVQPMSGYLLDEGEARIHDLGVRAGFSKLRTEFDGEDVRIDHVVLHHDPSQTTAQSLLECADEIGSDLIAAGSLQHSRLDRWLVGSVSAELVRDGRRSVLIVPPRRRE